MIFRYLRDRLWNRIQNGNGNSLSKAGKEVLLKSVAQALPSYCMNCFLLPTSLLDELQKMMNSFWWGSTSQRSRGIHWTNWNKLCTRKENGGLVFRNLEAYKLAMLAKQGWNLISTPNTLLSRILKAKYFPKRDFMETSLGSNPSFIWRSTWCSQAVLVQGLRWKIGDGQSVKIWTHPWLRNSNNLYVQTTNPHQEEITYVKDLMIPETKQWNFELIHEMYNPRDVMEVTNIPLNPIASKDERMWNFSRHGDYTVKSGHHQIMNNIMHHTQTHQKKGDWAQLWQISTPPKIRSFLWRAARDYLPCRIKLQSRKIQVPSQCVICESGLENNWHLFIDCPYAKECWKLANLGELVAQCAREEDSFPKWLFASLNKCPNSVQPNFSTVLWSLWRYRNEKLWKGVSRQPHTTVSLGFEMVMNWDQAQWKSSQGQTVISRQDTDDRWTKPPDPSMKCNVDAALFKEQRAIGFGTVVRDSTGNFMVCKTCVTSGWFDVKDAESLALLDAIQWTSSLELQDVIFETDSETVVKAITSKKVDYTEFGSIIFGCCQILEAHPSFKIQHARRQANRMSHTLARAALSFADPFITYHPPDIICNSINHDGGNNE